MRLCKAWLIFSLSCLSACGSGPRLNVCDVESANTQLRCTRPQTWWESLWNIQPDQWTVAFGDAGGYVTSPLVDLQKVYDWCANRHDTTQQAPDFYACTIHPDLNGAKCAHETCRLSNDGAGLDCDGQNQATIYDISAIDKWIAFEATDAQTLYDYCNIKLSSPLP